MKAQIMPKILIGLLLSFVAVLAVSSKAQAKEICWEQYGGGETCITVDDDSKIHVDKTIWNPDAEEWQDHISADSGSYPYTFGANETISFKIKVENTGDVKLVNIDLNDKLPSFIKYKDGDGDGEDDNTKVEFNDFDLYPGESRTFYFTARVADDEILPKDERVCLTNIAEAKGERDDDHDDKEEDSDYANFCIELPKVLGKESPDKLPVTGGERLKILVLTTSIGLILVGYGLKKLSQEA